MKKLKPEEAITILEDMKVNISIPKAAVTQIKRNAALNMAIDALLRCSEIPNESDTISRQAAIDILDAYQVMVENGEENPYAWARLRMSELPSAQPEQRWIPCDKGEPDEDMECWVTVKTTDALYRGNFTKRFGKGFVTSCGFMWWNTALAWMPIYEPEPYRTEEDDNHEG